MGLHWTTHPSQGSERIARCLGLFILCGDSCIWIHREGRSLGAFWDRCVIGFGWNFGLKKKPSWHQNRSKIGLGGIKNRSWDVLAGSLERSWWPKPKTEEGDQFFGGLLGPSWRALGAILGSSWLPKESQERPKSDPKIDQNLIPCWDHFLGRFW